MSWNYRVLSQGEGDMMSLSIYEVYYDADGIPTSCTVNPVAPYSSEDVEDLKESMKLILRAFDKPVLKYEDFV